jgi:nicotinamide riboside kinase
MEEKNENKLMVILSGPECSGKTVLTQQLADYFHEPFTREYAREFFIHKPPRQYTLDDVIHIDREQENRIQKLYQQANRLLFCDTNSLVNLIWCKVVFGHIPAEIAERLKAPHRALYLICAPDIPWEFDPLRENPSNRDQLFEQYIEAAEYYHLPYCIIKGTGEQRFHNALKAIDDHLRD